MTETMPAYRLVRWGESPELTEAPVPEPGPGEVRVRVGGNGLCHSDITMVSMPGEIAEALGWRLPFTLGHEVAGWVDALGPGVGGFDRGDAVALVSPYSCGACAFCVRGQDSACPHGLAGRGYGRDGGLATFVVAAAPRHVVRLGTLDPVEAGPLMDAGATSYHAVRRVLPRLVPGSTAVVVGVGGLGGFAVQLLRALSPARVIAVEPNPTRRQAAIDLGAHHTLAGVEPPTGQATVDAVRDATAGEGAHAVLDFVGTDATLAAGAASVRSFGALAVVGAGGGTLTRPWFGALPRDAEVFTFQGSSIADAHEIVRLAEAGLVHSEVDPFPLDEVALAYRRLDDGLLRGRAVVRP